MSERFEISFTEGGVDALETIITGGLALATEKALDSLLGDDNHGWYCTIRDTITDLEVTYWGVTKEDAQRKAHKEIKRKIEDFEYERKKEIRYFDRKQKEEEIRYLEREEEDEEEDEEETPSSDGSGCLMAISLIVGIALIIYLVIWLAVNIVIPVALLNSAFALTILAFVFRQYKTQFAIFALVGGIYLIFDVLNGWLSLGFVQNVVLNSNWISAFIFINAVAIGISTGILLQPLWLKAISTELINKRRKFVLKGATVALISIAVASGPTLLYTVQNPFVEHTSNTVVTKKKQISNTQNQNNSHLQPTRKTSSNSNENKRAKPTMIENQFIADSYFGTIGVKDFTLFIGRVEGNSVEGYNVTGTNKRPVKGKIVNKWTEETEYGGNYTIFKLILNEPGDDKWDGEFNIDLWISDIGRHGSGSWKSYNGKLERQIKINMTD